MSISETLKQKIDELDLDRRVNELAISAERGIGTALEMAGEFADQHRDEFTSWIEKAGEFVDDKTQGKYADQVTRVKQSVGSGLTKLADRHQAGPR